ncbi:hypothetical protein D3C71_2036810 [compost metagenome]
MDWKSKVFFEAVIEFASELTHLRFDQPFPLPGRAVELIMMLQAEVGEVIFAVVVIPLVEVGDLPGL